MIFARVKDFKFHKFAKFQIFTKSSNFIKKILNYHKFFVGSRLLFEKHWYWRPQNLWEWIPPIHYHRKKNLEILRRHLDRQHFQELRYLPKKASIQGRSSFKNFLLKIWAIFTKIVIKSASACLIGAAAQISKIHQNFGELSQFWWILEILISTSKFWKNLVTFVTPYSDQFWKILTLEFWLNRKVTINHRGGILILCQILNFAKIENLKSLTLAQIQILDR